MGKNQQHKKVLRSEKSKVKLKASAKAKFLPKGGNVTDTNFKIKPIVIREQLRAHSAGELLTRRKLNLKDLLTRLNHHNSAVKVAACEELLELVQGSPQDVVELSLHALLQGVCKLILDKEQKIRGKAIKLISEILAKVSAVKVTPFFDILVSYTICAMTHIDIGIQEDSLLIVDAFLKHSPALIVKAFHKMFSNFLSLISKLRNESDPSRTLTLNLGSKITSIRWRIKVLSRLQRILEIVVEENKPFGGHPRSCPIMIAEEIGHTIPIYKGMKRCPINFFSQSSVATNPEANAIHYVNVLVPLLYETWAEVVPLSTSSAADSATIIPPDAASILSCVIGIFNLLHQLVKQSDDKSKVFLARDNQRFFEHILNQFPYRQQDVPNQQKLKKQASQLLENNADPKCVRENLLISCVFCTIYKTFPSVHFQNKAKTILEYIKMCLVSRNYIISENVPILLATLRIIFFDNSEAWMQKQLNVQELLDNLLHFDVHTQVNTDSKVAVFNVLSDVVQLTHLTRSEKYQQWLTSQPLLLCQPEISERAVDTLSVLSRQNNKRFLESLRKQMPTILNNLTTIKIHESGLYPPVLKIVSMFSYIPVFQNQDLDVLIKFTNTCCDAKLVGYVEQLLQERQM